MTLNYYRLDKSKQEESEQSNKGTIRDWAEQYLVLKGKKFWRCVSECKNNETLSDQDRLQSKSKSLLVAVENKLKAWNYTL